MGDVGIEHRVVVWALLHYRIMGDVGIEHRVVVWALLHHRVIRGNVYVEHRAVF